MERPKQRQPCEELDVRQSINPNLLIRRPRDRNSRPNNPKQKQFDPRLPEHSSPNRPKHRQSHRSNHAQCCKSNAGGRRRDWLHDQREDRSDQVRWLANNIAPSTSARRALSVAPIEIALPRMDGQIGHTLMDDFEFAVTYLTTCSATCRSWSCVKSGKIGNATVSSDAASVCGSVPGFVPRYSKHSCK